MTNNNSEQFINGPVRYFRLIGFEFETTEKWMKFLLIIGLCNVSIVLVAQILFGALSDVELAERTAGISYLNYFLVSIGKMISLIYNRSVMVKTLNEFRMIYPSKHLEKTFKLQKYLKKYLLIERFITGFFKSITIFYCIFPVILCLTELVRNREFTYRTPLMLWYPIEIRNNYGFYIFTYLQQTWASFEVAIIILGTDLCLFSSLLQLCMHLEVIKRNILNIKPDKTEIAEKKLKKQIIYHQMVLRLAEKINDIFTPSVLFSLLASSFIICFTGYQLLGVIN
ncbi:odorant receptor 85c-like [Episyrphus balteatus]|uniref:odorant receptor 85c-like n=1 Tax=Episyrphus balteatus TaxID=286459 RepID=UPI002485DB65|nr:odorant receptor 85c-like [Episyrphus balteatus]